MHKRVKNYIIPNKENSHKPHSLRDASVKVLLSLTIAVEVIVVILVLPIFPAKLDYLSAILPGVLVHSANESRLDQKLAVLNENELLTQAAELKAEDMAARGYFSHTTPEGKQPWHFLNEVGYVYQAAGENLAVNFIDSEDVHNAWMRSQKHRENILETKFTEIGIATARGEYKGRQAIFVVQFFGTPRLYAAESDTVELSQINSVPDSSVQGAYTEVISLQKIASAPRHNVSILLWGLFYLISTSLILAFIVNSKKKHKNILFNGFLLVVIILSFLYINTSLIHYIGQI